MSLEKDPCTIEEVEDPHLVSQKSETTEMFRVLGCERGKRENRNLPCAHGAQRSFYSSQVLHIPVHHFPGSLQFINRSASSWKPGLCLPGRTRVPAVHEDLHGTCLCRPSYFAAAAAFAEASGSTAAEDPAEDERAQQWQQTGAAAGRAISF